MTRIALLALAIAFAAGSARAEELISGLSQDQIAITSNYTGTDLVVFGAIQASAHDDLSVEPDIVVLLRGPDVDMTVRKKERVVGLWINRHQDTLYGMPGYYYLASTRPLKGIAAPDVLASYQLGLDNIRPRDASAKSMRETAIYIAAAVSEEAEDKLYQQVSDGVVFLSPSLFRVTIPVPATVPRGEYTAIVYLFKHGNIVSAQTTPLFVDQTGLERRLFAFAHSKPLLYGLADVTMALMLGWMSSLLFRRR